MLQHLPLNPTGLPQSIQVVLWFVALLATGVQICSTCLDYLGVPKTPDMLRLRVIALLMTCQILFAIFGIVQAVRVGIDDVWTLSCYAVSSLCYIVTFLMFPPPVRRLEILSLFASIGLMMFFAQLTLSEKAEGSFVTATNGVISSWNGMIDSFNNLVDNIKSVETRQNNIAARQNSLIGREDDILSRTEALETELSRSTKIIEDTAQRRQSSAPSNHPK